MKTQNNKVSLGKKGELLAKNHLISKGYVFLDENFYSRFGEIDLVFKDGDILVFVEVKTRNGKQLKDIVETVNKLKVNRILKSAEIYINQKRVDFKEMRIDAVFIEKKKTDDRNFTIRHLESFY
jgi:putative endonuclease